MENLAIYPCPCCGYIVFDEQPGSYDICPICFWEDDIDHLRFPMKSGGANRISLIDWQRTFARIGACKASFIKYVRPPHESEVRDPNWRPIDERIDSFEEPGNLGNREPYPDDPTTLYCWRSSFWRRRDDQWQRSIPFFRKRGYGDFKVERTLIPDLVIY